MIPKSIIHNETDYETVLNGLDFILRHFQEPSVGLFPRTIMTHTLGYQKEVYSIDEAMQYFEESKYIDCRIRAYPDQSVISKFLRQNETAPSLIMIDIDKSSFPSIRTFEAALYNVRTKLGRETDGTPTVLWSGNGYHVIQPIDAVVLENIVELRKFHENPSEQFLRFAEWYLSGGKADSSHQRTLSFGNCLLRIPGSHNSKLISGKEVGEFTRVRIAQEWDGYRPNIRLLLGNFHAYLVDQRIKQLQKRDQVKYGCNGVFRSVDTIKEIPWIERLLQTPLPDGRKYCIWRILVPYLINIRKMSDDEALSIIIRWLEKCNDVKRLTFNYRHRSKYDIRNARKIGYFPISLYSLGSENIDLKLMLEQSQSL